MINPTNKKTAYPIDFNSISLKLASPERIREWSYGEVTKPETINYRTSRSERGGLFDERIFGPERDYECYCGKYRRIRYKDIVCERCGVEVTHSIVRRERMGHIELATPVAHIWFARGVPSRLALFLNLSAGDLEKVIYFAGYIVTEVNEGERSKMLKEIEHEYKQRLKNLQDERSREALKETLAAAKNILTGLAAGKVLDEVAYHHLSLKYGSVFEAAIGAEALYQLCRRTDLSVLEKELSAALSSASAPEKGRLLKRRNLVKAMRRAAVRPEWMFLTVIPVIPPDLRPMVALDGGRHATSDVNDLYRRVINRNNRLKKLLDLRAPEVILRNEKRILQEAVDALLDNSMRRSSGATSYPQRRPLKSLSDGFKGKQGRFRQHLLGKRVDYSGRSVIVVGPDLALHQCGLPKHIALELFRPFIIAKLLEYETAYNIRGASRLINDQVSEVWAILEEVIKDKYVFLNRAPTLHRLGIQAFQPVLIEGSAIQIHPLVCGAFNADFDGDQMAIHVPLSVEAQKEARELLAANKNILKPGNGNPVVNLRLDIILGCFWLTQFKVEAPGTGDIFGSHGEVVTAYLFDAVDLRAKIKLLADPTTKYHSGEERFLETSVGRVLFNEILPEDFPFINKEINNREINNLLEQLLFRYGTDGIAPILDRIKTFGFRYAGRSGATWGLDEVTTPPAKPEIVNASRREAAALEEQYNEGLLSNDERERLTIKVWSTAKGKIERLLLTGLAPESSVSLMLASGARGSTGQVSQMGGMKGLTLNAAGRVIDYPIISSYQEGLTPLEYFISTHGSRKTLTDTALNTAKAGYLTRRLVYVADDVMIAEVDCGDREGKLVSTSQTSGFERGIGRLIRGRILTRDLKTAGGKKLFSAGHLLSGEDAALAEAEGASEAQIRTVLTCRSVRGICQACYGLDLGRGNLVALGEPVGIVAAQAIGEPGTQLTMRTKHSGGVDVGGDIVGGLPRVEEIFERRAPKNAAVLAPLAGTVAEIKSSAQEKFILLEPAPGKAKGKKKTEPQKLSVPRLRDILVKAGDQVKRGQFLTDGAANLEEMFKYAGSDATEEYIINEINRIYELQGASISRKHIEVIIRQMFSRRRIKESGDTALDAGDIVPAWELAEVNEAQKKRGGRAAEGEVLLLGLSEISLTVGSGNFIAAVAFGQSTRTLIKTAIRGGVDRLRGLKENVIVGRLIPAGTGLNPHYAPAPAEIKTAAVNVFTR